MQRHTRDNPNRRMFLVWPLEQSTHSDEPIMHGTRRSTQRGQMCLGFAGLAFRARGRWQVD
jgi:hypothetical protein